MNSGADAAGRGGEDPLRLDQQVCFPLYAATNLLQRLYKPLLEPLGLTYAQYLVVLVLSAQAPISVGELGACLHLDIGTLSPLLKRMERAGCIKRRRDADDKRRVLLTLTSRIDQGKIALRLERVSLQAVLESAIDTSRPKIDAGLHALTVELPDEPAWIAGDFTRLSQVVSNLLTNAAKYTPAGGELRLSAGLEADFVQIEVEDNGVGVPPEMQERIFALYTQVPGPDTRSSEGLGIGLALVKQLVELHRGSIAVSSEGEDQGSRFTVRLPRSV